MVLGRIVLWLALALGPIMSLSAADAQIIKVLPHLLDLKGRHTIHPSLYERDGYQAYLRRQPAERSALRFDVQWKTISSHAGQLKLRVEARGSRTVAPVTVERAVRKKTWFRNWSPLILDGEDYAKFGELIAWRATLWESDRLLAEQKSFLW
jgi:hypothetical protein